jgi:sugar-specific transcriptional regulator TrmB
VEINKDLKRKLEDLSHENNELREQKRKLEQDLTDTKTLLEDAAYGSHDAASRIKELLERIQE